MEPNYVLALDQGTTGSTAMVVAISDRSGIPQIVASYNSPFKQYYPYPGWVEHDLEQIWQSILAAITKVLQFAQQSTYNFSPAKIAAIGLTNQRETTCLFAPGGAPRAKAIVWQCKRSSSWCLQLSQEQAFMDKIQQRTGLRLDPYFSASKIKWLLDNDPHLEDDFKHQRTLVGTIDSYLLMRLSGDKQHYTEPSNACRTLLYSLSSGNWDEELMEWLQLPKLPLAVIKDSVGHFGTTKGVAPLPDGIPITAILGDQQAALAGQGCYERGEAKCTYGTGAFLLINTASKPIISDKGLLTSVGWQIAQKRTFIQEGSVFAAGAAIEYLKHLGLINHVSECSYIDSQVKAANNIYFVPALAGLGAPWWSSQTKASLFGMSRDTSREQIILACLEGIAFQVEDILAIMRHDTALTSLKVDGGVCKNDLLMQSQANFSQLNLHRPDNLETTVLGAALFAALGAKLYSSLQEMNQTLSIEKTFTPAQDFKEHKSYLKGWHKAVKAAQAFS